MALDTTHIAGLQVAQHNNLQANNKQQQRTCAWWWRQACVAQVCMKQRPACTQQGSNTVLGPGLMLRIALLSPWCGAWRACGT